LKQVGRQRADVGISRRTGKQFFSSLRRKHGALRSDILELFEAENEARLYEDSDRVLCVLSTSASIRPTCSRRRTSIWRRESHRPSGSKPGWGFETAS
jgi:hypothetical protein